MDRFVTILVQVGMAGAVVGIGWGIYKAERKERSERGDGDNRRAG